MTNVKLVQFKFQPGKKQIWLDWSKELKRRKEEAIATLKDEGVVSESCFISEDGETIYYFMEAEDFEAVQKAASTSSHPIDADHKKAKESSLLRIAKLDCLFHFENR